MPESSKKTPRTAPSAADLAAAVRPREDAQEKAALAAIQSIADSLKYLCTTVPSLILEAAGNAKPRQPAKKPKKAKSPSKPKKDVSRRELEGALRKSGGTAAGAARLLNLSPQQVLTRMKRHGIEVRKPGRPSAEMPKIAPLFTADELAAKIGKVLDESR